MWYYNQYKSSFMFLICQTVLLPVETSSLFCKTLEGTHGVRSRAENEDQRGGGGHIVVKVTQVNWRVFHKLLPQADNHKLCCCKHHLERSGRKYNITKRV